ncbi:hypothetical protein BH24ACT15_BH24ACT15_37570 [soil metagenome]
MRRLTSWWLFASPDGEQIANANDDFVDLTPVSQAPAVQVRSRWLAVLPNQPIPLMWETRRSIDNG